MPCDAQVHRRLTNIVDDLPNVRRHDLEPTNEQRLARAGGRGVAASRVERPAQGGQFRECGGRGRDKGQSGRGGSRANNLQPTKQFRLAPTKPRETYAVDGRDVGRARVQRGE